MKLYTDLCEGGAWSNGNLLSKKDNKNIDPLKDKSFSLKQKYQMILLFYFISFNTFLIYGIISSVIPISITIIGLSPPDISQ